MLAPELDRIHILGRTWSLRTWDLAIVFDIWLWCCTWSRVLQVAFDLNAGLGCKAAVACGYRHLILLNLQVIFLIRWGPCWHIASFAIALISVRNLFSHQELRPLDLAAFFWGHLCGWIFMLARPLVPDILTHLEIPLNIIRSQFNFIIDS